MALLSVKDVQSVLGLPEQTAYKIIRELNTELKEQGYKTIRGKTVDWYLNARYGLSSKS